MLTVIIPRKGQVRTQKAPSHLLTFDYRWVHEGHYETSSLTLDKHHLRDMLAKRNVAYRRWFRYWGIPNRKIQWQEIRIINDTNSDHSTTKDYWFNRFIEGCFTVFLNPINLQDKDTKKVYQYYLLSPEDCCEVALQLHRDKGVFVPRRSIEGAELFFPKDQELSVPRIVPVEMCQHYRHETTGGVLTGLHRDGQYQEQHEEKEKKIIITPK